MPWLELKIIDAAPKDVAHLEQCLLDAGALSVTLEDGANQPILEPLPGEMPLWNQTRVIGLFDANTDTGTVQQIINPEGKLTSHWHILEDKQWEREWEKHFKPLQCGSNLWICPSWAPPPCPTAINLKLDPGLAFGTGTHPTTYLCLRWLSEQQLKGLSILDYGCGSGILAIAGLLIGAETVIAIDIDPQALCATRTNMLNNSVDLNRVQLALPAQAPNKQVDVVLANILASPLIDLARTLTSSVAPLGKLCLSGLLTSQIESVLEAYDKHFIFEPAHVKDEWACLTATKTV